MGRGESEMANQAQIPFITDLEEQEPQLSDDCSSGDRNTDRLRRNRESAKRCRLRRKEYIHGVETKCKTLESQNENLTKENAHLKALVEKLLTASGHPEDVELQVSPSKRIKIEDGVTSADFTNESAAGDSNLSAGHSDHLSVFNSVNTLGIDGLATLDSCLESDDRSNTHGKGPDTGIDDLQGSWFDDLQVIDTMLL